MIGKLLFLTIALVITQDVSGRKFDLQSLLQDRSGSLSKTKLIPSTRDDCEENGHRCLDCDVSRYCFQLPNEQWIQDDEDCTDKEQTCLESTGRCTSDSNPQCDEAVQNYKFVCHQVGFFPHAFDCTKYNLCLANGENVNPNPQEFTCAEGFSYDTLSTLCSRKLKGKCKQIAGICVRVGDSGPIANNPNMYYTCLTVEIDGKAHIVPHFFNCQLGKQYIDGECLDPTPPSLPIDDDGRCTKTGSFYDEDECKKYYECSLGGTPESKSCPSGEYFDGLKSECKPFVCPK